MEIHMRIDFISRIFGVLDEGIGNSFGWHYFYFVGAQENWLHWWEYSLRYGWFHTPIQVEAFVKQPKATCKSRRGYSTTQHGSDWHPKHTAFHVCTHKHKWHTLTCSMLSHTHATEQIRASPMWKRWRDKKIIRQKAPSNKNMKSFARFRPHSRFTYYIYIWMMCLGMCPAARWNRTLRRDENARVRERKKAI